MISRVVMFAHPFVLIILLPVVAGLLGYLIGRLRNEFSFIGTVASFYYAIRLFLISRANEPILWEVANIAESQ